MRNIDEQLKKRLKRENNPTSSFWEDSNKNICETEYSFSENEYSFTSLEICEKDSKKKKASIKFIIRDIMISEDHITLLGDDVICKVSGEWCDIVFEINTKITVICCYCCEKELKSTEEEGYLHVEVTDTENFLFIEDDLMTITNFVTAIRCINKPFVSAKVADINFRFNDKCLVKGIILHEIMENCILKQNFMVSFIMKHLKEAIKNNIMNIYLCETTEEIIESDIICLIKNIVSFDKQNLVFDECEKRVISLTMNLKGNIDAVGGNKLLEIKSGKSMDITHKAQVMLYSTMLNEKYGISYVPYLYYITSNYLSKVNIKHAEIKSLMIIRNKLCAINEIVECKCSAIEICRIIQEILSLPENHFLRRMYVAIGKEEKQQQIETWHMVNLEKQIDTMVIFTYEDKKFMSDDPYINIYTEEMIKLCKGIIINMTDTHIHVSLSEKINLEKKSAYYISFGTSDLFFKFMRYSLTQIAYYRYANTGEKNGFTLPDEEKGLVTEMASSEIYEDFSSDDIELSDIDMRKEDHSIEKSNNNSKQQSYIYTNKFKERETEGSANSPTKEISHDPENTNIENSSSFMYFTPVLSSPQKYKYSIPDIFLEEFLKLNENQMTSLYTSLNCENYNIIHGMPGTGKSTVIILLIKILVHLKKKVLLVCYTNLAISNIMNKLGSIRTYRATKESRNYNSVSDIKIHFKNISLVASTCFGFRDPIFVENKFDYCIIDEGSQQHLLLTLIPISLCNKFVIFGDHLQLKPLTKASKELGISLFEYLLDENKSELTVQYRMGPNIMNLANLLFYNNKLQSGVIFKDEVIFIDSSEMNYKEYMSNVKDTTILCYFNQKVKEIRSMTDCPVETIDRFQGSEADHVIVIFDPVVKCDVLESRERLNVAITRAKKKLVLIGDKLKMLDIEVLKTLLKAIHEL